MKGWIHGDIEPLLMEWSQLKSAWERNPGQVNWQRLRALAERCAVARDKSTGETVIKRLMASESPDLIHEKFLEYLAESGFDPFEPDSADRPARESPPIDHEALLELCERGNESARRMKSICDRAAREKYAGLLNPSSRARAPSPEELEGLERSWAMFRLAAPLDLRSKWRPGSQLHKTELRRADGEGEGASHRRLHSGVEPSER